ncbi:1-phosphofructokinase [Evansella caseinilytica]|uniref:Tagatose-6-phosphate kinase n=1 Tax=Evansella caseinilytica TaxID=1503961 RepID=A0A1H3J203_9BACI|nr:1-phosphofructokinase [Evansella caseinilytica]SDY34033.1 1-phosphofructokinase [Evansella caseinilytica]
MIYTLTLNPSVDYIVTVDQFAAGKTNRTSAEMKNPGGKGINVSRVLNHLNIKTKALGFIGGFTGEFIEKSLQNEGVETNFIKVDGDTRINIKLRADAETEINGRSPKIGQKHLDQLKKQLRQLKSGDILVLAGSVPDCLPATIYRELVQEIDSNEVKIIVDTSGQPLIESLSASPFLIKPNHHELADVFGVSNISVNEAATLGKKLIDKGVDNIIVSMAGEGALFIHRDKTILGSVPKGDVKNSVGAGDSVVAGFIASYIYSDSLEEAFRYGLAAGSATAFSEGFCQKELINKLMKEVSITNL